MSRIILVNEYRFSLTTNQRTVLSAMTFQQSEQGRCLGHEPVTVMRIKKAGEGAREERGDEQGRRRANLPSGLAIFRSRSRSRSREAVPLVRADQRARSSRQARRGTWKLGMGGHTAAARALPLHAAAGLSSGENTPLFIYI